jgi:cation diffusion facilitator family transporter
MASDSSTQAFDPHEPLRHPKAVLGSAESKTRGVVYLTFVAAVGEVVYGTITHSMALVADGWHMATHVGALSLTAAAYWYARIHATRDRFSFGPGKIYALAGFTNAVLLILAALWFLVESIERVVHPEVIDFSQAIPVSIVGLAVNVASAFLLHAVGDEHGHDHGHDHAHDHAHAHEHEHVHEHEHAHDHAHAPRTHAHHPGSHDVAHGVHMHGARSSRRPPAQPSALTHDHNLHAAYLHVVADALTSVLAIVALVVGRKTGFTLLDPLMGVLGAVIIGRWAWGLLQKTSRPLLDMVPASIDVAHLREVLEDASAGEVVDLHVWEMGPGEVCCLVALAAHKPVDIETCRRIVTQETAVDHLTIELRPCAADHVKAPRVLDRSGRDHHAHAHDHAHHGGHQH